MGIMTRFIRIWQADVNGVMDQLEDKGLLLKQCLRDMAAEITNLEDKLNSLVGEQDLALQEIDRSAAEIVKFEEDLNTALHKDKDDIARMLLRKINPLVAHNVNIASHLKGINSEIEGVRQNIGQRHLQFSELQIRARGYWQQTEMRKNVISPTFAEYCPHDGSELSDEEIDLELIKRKDSLRRATKGGTEK